MARFFWIASYPKSGSTWIRFIVANLLRGPIRRSGDVEAMIPDTHKISPRELAPVHRDIVFMKTHWMSSRLGEAVQRSAGAIYVLRNPLDVYCSCLHYLNVDPSRRHLALHEFSVNLGVPRWLISGIGSLPRNAASWIGAPLPFPRLLLRYEDLSAAPLVAIERVCAFLGLDASAETVARAAENSSFAAMRALEEAELARGVEGFFGHETAGPRRHRADWHFMNRGRVGGYKEELGADEIEVLGRAFRDFMDEFGYALDAAGDLAVRADYPARARHAEGRVAPARRAQSGS